MTRSDPKRDRTVGAADPWSVKGLDPKARVLAQAVARRSGMTLADWLNQVITDAGEGAAPAAGKTPSRASRAAPASAAAAKPKAKAARSRRPIPPEPKTTEAAQLRAVLADLAHRLDVVERRSPLDEVRERQNGTDLRLQRMENQEALRIEASQALEDAIGAVAEQIYEAEARAELQDLHVRESLRALRRRVDRIEAHPHAGAFAIEAGPPAEASTIDAALSSLARRVEEGQRHTSSALQALGGALAGLEQLVRDGVAAPPASSPRMQASAEIEALQPRPEAGDPAHGPEPSVRAPAHPVAETTVASAAGAPDPIEAAVRDLSDMVVATEHRSTSAIHQMSQEVLRFAQSLDDRVGGVERRSDQLAAEIGGEIARIADVVGDCVARADEIQAATLDRLVAKSADAVDPPVERARVAERRSAPTALETVEEAAAPPPQIEGGRIAGAAAAQDNPADQGRPMDDWSVESFAETRVPVEARAVGAQTSTQMLDRLCEALPSASDATGAARDASDIVLDLAGDEPEPVAPSAAADGIEEEDRPEAVQVAVEPPPPAPSVRRTSASPAQAGSNLGLPTDEGADRLSAVDSFLAAELTPLTAPRPFAPAPLPPAPEVRAGANRELIENARTAARLNAETKRRSPLDVLTAKSEPTSEAGDVLDLRNGFGLLKRRKA